MRKYITLCCAATLAIAASCSQNAGAPDGQYGPYTVDTIIEDVYHIQDCNDENPAGETFDENGNKTHFNNCSDIYLLVGSEKALVIDLSNKINWADNAETSLRKIIRERAGSRPVEITFTHNHGDHTGMLPAFVDDPEVRFALPSVDFTGLADKFPSDRSSFYDEGYEFHLGGLDVETVMVSGHTPGSMVFFIKGKDIVFTGDAIGSGHGTWIFNPEGFENYVEGVNHLVEYINDEANGIDQDALKVYGGHFWQKDWFPETGDNVFGIQYINDMQQLVLRIIDGTAVEEPSDLNHRVLDTYFKNGQAIVAWNRQFAEDFRNSR